MELVPCDVDPHTGLGLGSETLSVTLGMADVPWLTRPTCRAFRDRSPPGPYAAEHVARSVSGLERALALGMPTMRLGSWIASGPLDVVAWAHARGILGARACDWAAYAGRIDTLAWLVDHGYMVDANTCAAAAYGGRLVALEWLKSRWCPWNFWTTRAAAAGGHLGVLQWAHLAGCAVDCRAFTEAAAGGHVGVLEWLRGAGATWDASNGEVAAAAGHIDVLEWATDHGYTCTGACRGAAAAGRLPVLKWLHERGYAWDEGTTSRAESSGDVELLEWVLAHGCPPDPNPSTYESARIGALAMLEWRDRLGHDWSNDGLASSGAGAGGQVGVLEWLEARGGMSMFMAAYGAACGGHPRVLDWLHEHGHQFCESISNVAAERCRLDAIEWLVRHGVPSDVDWVVSYATSWLDYGRRQLAAAPPCQRYLPDRRDKDAVVRWLRNLHGSAATTARAV